MIVGIDEVGRGAWAGPLVVAAVSLGGQTIDGLTDSKLLTKKKRERLSLEIKQIAPLVGIGWVSARDIDTIGLSAALKLAAQRAMRQIDTKSIEQIIIDGTIRLIDDPRVTLMKKADLLVPSVSAASVIAKVARDHYMALCDDVFSGYGFTGHVGYGAAKHREAIENHGVLPIHRASFAPIMYALQRNEGAINSHMKKNGTHLQTDTDDSSEGASTAAKDTTHVGKLAEQMAADYLVAQGYSIIDRNWKTRWCEIDIIATKHEVVHFVEVKFRRRVDQGGGLAAITPQKLRQMRFAAELWLQRNPNLDARLSAIDVAGEDMVVMKMLEDIS